MNNSTPSPPIRSTGLWAPFNWKCRFLTHETMKRMRRARVRVYWVRHNGLCSFAVTFHRSIITTLCSVNRCTASTITSSFSLTPLHAPRHLRCRHTHPMPPRYRHRRRRHRRRRRRRHCAPRAMYTRRAMASYGITPRPRPHIAMRMEIRVSRSGRIFLHVTVRAFISQTPLRDRATI